MERSRRLREPHDIRRVRSKGRSYPEGPVVVRVLPNRIDPPANRYTVIAGKKQGGSVQRNRVKRLLREALRHVDPTLAQGLDLLVLVRGRAEDIPDYAAARAIVDRVIARAGIAKTAPATPATPVIPTKEGSRPATTPTETPRASG
jgi:ribonuclease P protein component